MRQAFLFASIVPRWQDERHSFSSINHCVFGRLMVSRSESVSAGLKIR
jgi:hypothetical protein